MKKYIRLSQEERQKEIKEAALPLFLQRGFSATTMESIVDQISLSKGGLYRIYPSTKAILADLLLDGMHTRNQFYLEKVKTFQQSGIAMNGRAVAELIFDSLFLLPETAELYVELLIEKRRDPELEILYQDICRQTMDETAVLISSLPLPAETRINLQGLLPLQQIMDAVTLSSVVLGLRSELDKWRTHLVNLIQNIISVTDEKGGQNGK